MHMPLVVYEIVLKKFAGGSWEKGRTALTRDWSRYSGARDPSILLRLSPYRTVRNSSRTHSFQTLLSLPPDTHV